MTALVGPNGAGKSTLIRGCVGFERPDEGNIIVAGIDLRRNPRGALKRAAYLSQSPALYRGFTVDDHFDLATVARPSFDRQIGIDLTDAAGVDRRRPIRELSGGQQAQVALALALGTRATVLLLDEPLASLDPLARRNFLSALLARVREDGSTVLLSSHLVSDIEQVCDRVLVLSRGELVLDTTLDDATSQFRVLQDGEAIDRPVVGEFASARGETMTLVRSADGGRKPSLEEVVLGHLAARPTQ